MKKKENKLIIKDPPRKLSPSPKRKVHFFSNNLLKDFEINSVRISPKKSQDELLLSKRKLMPNTSHHRRTKSNNQNYIQFTTSNNTNLNSSVSKLSFIYRRKDKESEPSTNSVSRNVKYRHNLNINKKTSNLLSTSFSLKDFRNNLINVFSHNDILETQYNNKYNNYMNLKHNKSLLFSFDNPTNIEETRNTTSITGFNNSNLLYNNHLNNKNKKNAKSTKYIKINTKKNIPLYYSSKNNSSKIISFTNNNIIKEKGSPKKNLHRYIYKHNNIKTKNNMSKINNTNKLALTKKTFKYNHKSACRSTKDKKLFINPNNETNYINFNCLDLKDNLDYEMSSIRTLRNTNMVNCSSTTNNSKKKSKKETYTKYKKRKTKSQENDYKIGINENDIDFKSVEEIHFIFVQMYQKKKAFFEKKSKK
jgi:hypothetical protein